MNQDPRLGFLGILYSRDKALIGETLLHQAEQVRFVVVANNITSNEGKKIQASFARRHIPMDMSFTAEELGMALGHDAVNFVGITDKKAAEAYAVKSLRKGVNE
jgi:ribosomal protein L7Ae-like RNA K-turn-binding protein